MPFEIVRNDITKMVVDAIVNTANPRPVIGSGTDSMIHEKAGPRLLEVRQQIGDIACGNAVATPAFDLQAKYVIHTVGPIWFDGDHSEAKLLHNCYSNSLNLAKEIGCAYHVCHISAKESVEAIRRAKADGVDVTCETAPHYLVMNDSMLLEEGRFKMNPPLRSADDRKALLEGLLDGTIDMIATDHAPHSAEEKGRGLEKSAFGIVGLETAFPVLYTYMVRAGVLTMEKLVETMCVNPRKRFGIPQGHDFAIWDLGEVYTVDPEKFVTMGRATPFAGHTLRGKCLMTVVDGQVVYKA